MRCHLQPVRRLVCTFRCLHKEQRDQSVSGACMSGGSFVVSCPVAGTRARNSPIGIVRRIWSGRERSIVCPPTPRCSKGYRAIPLDDGESASDVNERGRRTSSFDSFERKSERATAQTFAVGDRHADQGRVSCRLGNDGSGPSLDPSTPSPQPAMEECEESCSLRGCDKGEGGGKSSGSKTSSSSVW